MSPSNSEMDFGKPRSSSARAASKRAATGAKNGQAKQLLVVGSYTLDARSFELLTPTRGKIRLTPVQFNLLYILMSHPGQTFSPIRLLDEVWDYPIDAGSPDLVRVHIKNLRERIETDPKSPSFIRTVTGYGYAVGLE